MTFPYFESRLKQRTLQSNYNQTVFSNLCDVFETLFSEMCCVLKHLFHSNRESVLRHYFVDFCYHSIDMRCYGNRMEQFCLDTKDLVDIILKYLWWKMEETSYIG